VVIGLIEVNADSDWRPCREGITGVPKRDLTVGVPSAVADGHFQIAAGLAQGAALVREMRVPISEEGNSSMARGGMADVTK